MKQRVSAASTALVVILLLSACGSQEPTAQQPTPTIPPIPTVPPRPHPSPVAKLLDPPPNDCPTGQPPPKSLPITNQFGLSGSGKLQGSPPVWIVDFFYPSMTLHLEQSGYTEWPQDKIVWEIGPDFTQEVQLPLRNLRTGELAWWGSDPDAWSGKTFIMDPKRPDINGPYWYHGPRSSYPAPLAGTRNEWGSAFLITRAGCYDLQARWPGGQWDMFFAAGR